MFRRLVATSRAPQIMVLSMLRSFGKIGPQIDQIRAWLSRGHRWSPGVRNPLKSSVTGPSLLVNCYLEIKFHKIIRVNPPPPPPPLNQSIDCWRMFGRETPDLQGLALKLLLVIFGQLLWIQLHHVRVYINSLNGKLLDYWAGGETCVYIHWN